MALTRFNRAVSAGVLSIAAFNLISALSMPVADRRPSPVAAAIVTLLLLAHATLYWTGERVVQRIGVGWYIAIQAALIFGVGVAGFLVPVGLALFIALTAQTILIGAGRWNTLWVTFAAIIVFAVNALVTSNLYFSATAALLLAITGMVTHALAAVLMRRPEVPVPVASSSNGATPPAAPDAHVDAENNLTAREMQVLKALAGGARSSQIATELGIAERTVKAHLARIYQKLGVDSRAAAVAAAHKRHFI